MLYHWGTLMKFGNSSSFKHKQLHYCLILIVRCRNPQVILSNSLSGAAIIDKVLTGGGRATGMQISFVLESCWAARRPKWTGAHLLFLSLIVRYVSKNQGAKSPCGSAAAAAAASQEEEKMFQLWSPSLSSVHTESADHWSPVERLRS